MEPSRYFSSSVPSGDSEQPVLQEGTRGRGRPKRPATTPLAPPTPLAVRRLALLVGNDPSFSRRRPTTIDTNPVSHSLEDDIDFERLTFFDFNDVFGRNDQEAIEKLKASNVVIPPDDLERFRCPKCDSQLRRIEYQGVFGYQYRCSQKLHWYR